MPEVKPAAETFAKIKVVGVGGAGNNALNRMIEGGIRGVEFIAINTDVQALNNNKAQTKIHIGQNVTKGLGAGMNPDLGKLAAEESLEEVRDVLKGSDMVFITCGLGGGTGTGAAPIIADISKELGALTIAVVTKPFFFEGGQRRRIAEKGYEDLSSRVDTIIAVSNEKLLSVIDRKTSLLDSFKMADNILRQGVQGIAEIITVPGVVNADFADVKAIMANTGSALMGIGEGHGENRAEDAVKAAVNSNLLDTSIKGAKGIVFTVTGGTDMTMSDVAEAAKIINSLADEDAKIIFGAVVDDKLKDELKITVVATGFSERPEAARAPSDKNRGYSPTSYLLQEKKEEEIKENEKKVAINPSWLEGLSRKASPGEFKSNKVREDENDDFEEEDIPVKKLSVPARDFNTDEEDEEELSVPAFLRKKMK